MAVLARLLATCPVESLRKGAEAATLAKHANQLCGGSRADVLDALAAAYAENGQFAEAVATARKAVAPASQGNRGGLADEILRGCGRMKAIGRGDVLGGVRPMAASHSWMSLSL